MPIDRNNRSEEAVAIGTVKGIEERRPQSSETEAAAASTSSRRSNRNELHRLVNEVVQRTLVNVEFCDSIYVDPPPTMHPNGEEVRIKEEIVDDAESASSTHEKGTPTLRRSSRLTATPTNGKASNGTLENSSKRKAPKEGQNTSTKHTLSKKRRASMISVTSDASDMVMPTLEAAHVVSTDEEDLESNREASTATATAELVNYGADTPLGKQLATMLATMMTKNTEQPAENGNDNVVEDEEEESTSMPPLSPLHVEPDTEEHCSCSCCKNTGRQISELKQQMDEMMTLLREVVGKPKRPAVNSPLNLKDALLPYTKSLPVLKSLAPPLTTKFRPASKAEISLQRPAVTSSTALLPFKGSSDPELPKLKSEVLSESARSPPGHGKKTAVFVRSKKGSHCTNKKAKESVEEVNGRDKKGFAHSNDDGSPAVLTNSRPS